MVNRSMSKPPHEAGRPWFVRGRKGGECHLVPASPVGWLLTALYAAMAALISVLFLGGGRIGVSQWVGWGVLIAAATFIYLLTAWRTSVPVSGMNGVHRCARSAGTPASTTQTLLIAIATALLIIGSAALGVQL